MKNYNSFDLINNKNETLTKEELYFELKSRVAEAKGLINAVNGLMSSGFSQENALKLVDMTLEDYYTFGMKKYEKELIEKLGKVEYEKLIEATLTYFNNTAILK